jgi:hypothetical protein
MSKNLTRKSLAFGALVALTSSLFVGTPAQAADEVVLAPNSGSTYGMISGETFTLKASLGATVSSGSFNKLSYQITNAAGLTLDASAAQGANDGDSSLTGNTMTTAQVIRGDDFDDGVSTLVLDVDAADSGTVQVVAWIDSNTNGLVDDAFKSATQTVTFVKAADVTFTTVIAQPYIGDAKVTAVVTADKSMNMSQLSSAVTVGFAEVASGVYSDLGNSTVSSVGAFTAGETTTFVTADNSLKAESVASVSGSKSYAAQAIYAAAEKAWSRTGGAFLHDGLCRIDFFADSNGTLVVNEYENLDATYTKLGGTSEANTKSFLRSYYFKKINKLIKTVN